MLWRDWVDLSGLEPTTSSIHSKGQVYLYSKENWLIPPRQSNGCALRTVSLALFSEPHIWFRTGSFFDITTLTTSTLCVRALAGTVSRSVPSSYRKETGSCVRSSNAFSGRGASFQITSSRNPGNK